MPPKAKRLPPVAAEIAAIEPKAFQRALLQWYDANRRYLPWRATVEPDDEKGCSGLPALTHAAPSSPTASGGAARAGAIVGDAMSLRGKDAERAAAGHRVTPYGIWISEVMSQQTQIATVVPYWVRWMGLFPTPSALADAPDDAVREAWAGLGFYRRASLLHRGAQHVRDACGGRVPRTAAALLEVPGVGDYTAAAIASASFQEEVAAVDGNVLRVVTRLAGRRGIDIKVPAAAPQVRADACHLIAGAGRPGDFNQAMMELGATVCRPRAPLCAECPLRGSCRARAMLYGGEIDDIEGVIPMTSKALSKRLDAFAVAAVVRTLGGKSPEVLLVKREGSGLLAGFWELPAVQLKAAATADVDAVLQRGAQSLAKKLGAGARALDTPVRHIFSHIDYRSRVVLVSTTTGSKAAPDAAALAAVDGGVSEQRYVALDALLSNAPPVALSALTLKHLAAVADALGDAAGTGAAAAPPRKKGRSTRDSS